MPEMSILAESSQLIKYSSPSNSHLKQKSNPTGLFVMQHKLVGHFGGSSLLKIVHFAGLAPPRALDGVL